MAQFEMVGERFLVKNQNEIWFNGVHKILEAKSGQEALAWRKTLYVCESRNMHKIQACEHSNGVCMSLKREFVLVAGGFSRKRLGE